MARSSGMIQKTIGFSTSVTHLRPPRGQTWILYGAVRVDASNLALSLTDGITSQQVLNSTQNLRVIAVTHDWWLTCAAASLTTGYVLTFELGYDGYSFRDDLMDITSITAANMRALNTTPQSLIAAPGMGKAIRIIDVRVAMGGTTAFGGIAAGEDLTVRYTDGTGTVLATIETTGLLDQADRPAVTVGATPGVALEENAAVVLANSGAITGGSAVTVTVAYAIDDV